eukprot:SAG11_NODE_33947_length_274_cov_1.182857_1_plen_45_part_10
MVPTNDTVGRRGRSGELCAFEALRLWSQGGGGDVARPVGAVVGIV